MIILWLVIKWTCHVVKLYYRVKLEIMYKIFWNSLIHLFQPMFLIKRINQFTKRRLLRMVFGNKWNLIIVLKFSKYDLIFVRFFGTERDWIFIFEKFDIVYSFEIIPFFFVGMIVPVIMLFNLHWLDVNLLFFIFRTIKCFHRLLFFSFLLQRRNRHLGFIKNLLNVIILIFFLAIKTIR